MADRYDPKVSPRPSADRRTGDPRAGTEDDPLAELAKIVQGRPLGASASARGRSAANEQAAKPSGGDPFSDLEAELLNDLQASFAAVKEAAAAPTARPPVREPDPPLVEPEEDAFAAPPAIERPTPPQAAVPRPEPSRPEAAPLEFRMEPLQDGPPRFVPIPPAPVMQPPVQQRSAPMAEPPPADRAARAAARPPLAGDPRPEKRADVGGNFQLRPTAPVVQNPAPPQSRQAHSRWEKPEPAKPQASSASRFAPPKAAPAPQPQQSFDDLDDDLDPFADGGVFADAGKSEGDGQFPLDGFGLAPGYGEEDENLPPFEDDDEFAAASKPRSRRNLVIVGVVAAVAIAGAGVFAVLTNGTGSTGTPPIIAADGSPTKITPDDTAGAADADPQSKLIYDRIASGENASTDTTLLTPGDGPIADVPADGQTADPLARVIIPGGPGVDAPQTDDALGLADQPGAVEPPVAGQPTDIVANDTADVIEAIGPRKVRTVVVKPDGTIVSSAATDAPSADQPIAEAPMAVVPPTPVPPPLPAPVTDDTAAIAGNTTAELPITAVPDASTGNSTLAAEPPPAEVVAPAPEPQPPAVETPPAKSVVAATNDAPLDLTANPPPAAQATAGGMLVQISSQRSEDAARATYRDLQARYPRILGSFDANIQRAEIPDRGVFYRVRVGPFSAGDAQRLCDDLKSAGGDCILAQR